MLYDYTRSSRFSTVILMSLYNIQNYFVYLFTALHILIINTFSALFVLVASLKWIEVKHSVCITAINMMTRVIYRHWLPVWFVTSNRYYITKKKVQMLFVYCY